MFSGVVKAKRNPDFNAVRRIASPEIYQDFQLLQLFVLTLSQTAIAGMLLENRVHTATFRHLRSNDALAPQVCSCFIFRAACYYNARAESDERQSATPNEVSFINRSDTNSRTLPYYSYVFRTLLRI
jgi:hypothetical protein